MNRIPTDERNISDETVFRAFDLSNPKLHAVRTYLEQGNLHMAKKELVHYFETRTTPSYFYDYRALPLTNMDTQTHPSFFFTGAGENFKEFCIYAGRKLTEHIYVRHGNEGIEIDLGPDYENLPDFNYYTDQGKKHRTILDIFVRGHIFEYLSVLYHETGDKQVLAQFEESLQMFFSHYPLVLENTDSDASHFSFTQERDVMSVGYLALQYLALLYTRLPYEISTELAFELIKKIWFLGIQFRRFDADPYKRYNHHMWERGLVPYMLAILLPEISDFAAAKEHGADVIRQHIRDDFNEQGGYSEHSIAYWSGAALGGMLCRGIYLARLNGQTLLDNDTEQRIKRSYDALAYICPPQSMYPAIGDNGGSAAESVLATGAMVCGNHSCKELLDYRLGKTTLAPVQPLDYCDDTCGFVCSKSSHRTDADYILMSAKINCGISGHNHMDMLSVAVSFGGQEFIGEPHARQLYHTIRMGSDERGYMYNMESHNTVLAYGKPVLPNRMYANKWGVYRPDSPVTAFHSCKDGVYASAFHDAYTVCRHQREILFHRSKGLILQDTVFSGCRMPDPHIQRFHLMPDVSCTQVEDGAVLLEKQGVYVLLLWAGTPALHIWKKDSLCPEIVKKKEDLSTIIDVSFKALSGENDVRQSVWMLPSTGHIPDAAKYGRLRETMAMIALEHDAERALNLF